LIKRRGIGFGQEEFAHFIVLVAQGLRKEASKHQSQWRKEAREAFEFRDGDQWDSTDRAKLEEQQRPVVTFNRVAPILDSIVGHEMGNRQELRFIPRGAGETPPWRVLSAATISGRSEKVSVM